MPRLDCGERKINETAQQLMRGSFVEIVLCGQFCFGDQESVFCVLYVCVRERERERERLWEGGRVAYQSGSLSTDVTQDAVEPQRERERERGERDADAEELDESHAVNEENLTRLWV